jgi:methylenetetrahydrofolate reductase (NADPH)
LWGHPTKFEEITSLFARFCSGELKALPWSDQPVAVETSVISKQLAQINQLGFLTINSQPAVNGIGSGDKVYGWGPSNGYVYQKVGNFFAKGKSFTMIIPPLGISGVLREPPTAICSS